MKVCQITGKTAMSGHNVSHSNIKTNRRFSINLRSKRIYSEEEGRFITLKLTTSALRTINKKGLAAVLKEAKALPKVY